MTADDYLRQVERALGDLPWSQRRDLVAELREHLAELPPDTDFGKRLGSPEKYAADLRSAAGLEQRRGPVAFIRARRPRNLVIVVIVVTLVLTLTGLTIGAVAWIDSYQPLENAGMVIVPPGSKLSLGQDGYTAFFRKGRPFEYGVGINNEGQYSVRVLGVPRPRNDFFAGPLMMSVDQECRSMEPLERFHPFDLKPHSCRYLVFKGVYACGNTRWDSGAKSYNGFGLGDFPVRYGFHWKTATASIPLSEPLEISFRKEGCPEPVKP